MPNRMIRDGLLTSWRYERLSSDAKLFLYHVLLCADDLGCIELGPTYLRRRVLFSQDSDERIAKLIAELSDVDLLRPYQHDRTCYGFIPRFGQRVQIKYAKYPQPPRELYADDEDALKKFNKINEETIKSTDGQRLDSGWPDDGQRTVSGKREAVSGKRKEKSTSASDDAHADDFERAWKAYPPRAGGNSKAAAFKAYLARIKEGYTPESLYAGVVRYAAYCRSSEKIGTEYVKQGSTFFGPGLHFLPDGAPAQSIPEERL